MRTSPTRTTPTLAPTPTLAAPALATAQSLSPISPSPIAPTSPAPHDALQMLDMLNPKSLVLAQKTIEEREFRARALLKVFPEPVVEPFTLTTASWISVDPHVLERSLTSFSRRSGVLVNEIFDPSKLYIPDVRFFFIPTSLSID